MRDTAVARLQVDGMDIADNLATGSFSVIDPTSVHKVMATSRKIDRSVCTILL